MSYVIVGQRFGKLVCESLHLQGRAPSLDIWLCKCDCGFHSRTRVGDLLRGTTKNCRSCANTNMWNSRDKGNDVANHPLFETWACMRKRCRNPNNTNYARYEGRGITVCERWNKFENFVLDMGMPPTPQHTLDRKDNNGNYEPSNCRWATKTQQVLNRG